MPQYLPTATRILVPGGTLIEECVGRVNSGTNSASVARMRSPSICRPAFAPEHARRDEPNPE